MPDIEVMYEAMKDLAIGCGCVLVAYILRLGTDCYYNSVGDSIVHGEIVLCSRLLSKPVYFLSMASYSIRFTIRFPILPLHQVVLGEFEKASNFI